MKDFHPGDINRQGVYGHRENIGEGLIDGFVQVDKFASIKTEGLKKR